MARRHGERALSGSGRPGPRPATPRPAAALRLAVALLSACAPGPPPPPAPACPAVLPVRAEFWRPGLDPATRIAWAGGADRPADARADGVSARLEEALLACAAPWRALTGEGLRATVAWQADGGGLKAVALSDDAGAALQIPAPLAACAEERLWNLTLPAAPPEGAFLFDLPPALPGER